MPDPFSFNLIGPAVPDLTGATTHVVPHRRLARLLAFAGRSIDDVVNSGVAKREVAHIFKVNREIARRAEVLDLERQWNPLGRSA